jgi:hypothetical protein
MRQAAATRAAGGKCDGSISWLWDRRGFPRVAQELDGKAGFRAELACAMGSLSRGRVLMSPVTGKAREPVRITGKIS